MFRSLCLCGTSNVQSFGEEIEQDITLCDKFG